MKETCMVLFIFPSVILVWEAAVKTQLPQHSLVTQSTFTDYIKCDDMLKYINFWYTQAWNNPDLKRGGGNTWKTVIILGRKTREDDKKRQSASSLILLLGAKATGKEKKELHSYKHHLTLFCNIKPLLSPRSIQDSSYTEGCSYEAKSTVLANSLFWSPNHTFKSLCSPSTLEQKYWSSRYCFILLKNILKGGG